MESSFDSPTSEVFYKIYESDSLIKKRTWGFKNLFSLTFLFGKNHNQGEWTW
jgi:hypothetical protein